MSVARKLQRSTLTAAFLLLRYRCTRAAMLREGIPGPRLSPLPRRARYRLKLRVVDAAFQRVWRTRRLTAAVERWEAQAAVRHQQRGVMAETARRWARRRRMRAVVASWLVAIEARLRKKRLTLHCVSLWASGTSVAPAAALACDRPDEPMRQAVRCARTRCGTRTWPARLGTSGCWPRLSARWPTGSPAAHLVRPLLGAPAACTQRHAKPALCHIPPPAAEPALARARLVARAPRADDGDARDGARALQPALPEEDASAAVAGLNLLEALDKRRQGSPASPAWLGHGAGAPGTATRAQLSEYLGAWA